MDYDRIFENDLDRKFFYTDYPGRKMMVGRISLNNAIARMSKDELYTFVTYQAGDELPKEYVPLNGLESIDGTLFATLNPNITRFNYICRTGGIQRISRLFDSPSGSPRYLLGPGPDEVLLEDLIMEQYDKYMKEKTSSVSRGR